mmetsp:Transcript_82168/g.266277  ORF Transcript_82168/g.266277 Transcript_82168/m.266277 type:complete len:228 (-) Transcript_82168:385-1068(-)
MRTSVNQTGPARRFQLQLQSLELLLVWASSLPHLLRCHRCVVHAQAVPQADARRPEELRRRVEHQGAQQVLRRINEGRGEVAGQQDVEAVDHRLREEVSAAPGSACPGAACKGGLGGRLAGLGGRARKHMSGGGVGEHKVAQQPHDGAHMQEDPQVRQQTMVHNEHAHRLHGAQHGKLEEPRRGQVLDAEDAGGQHQPARHVHEQRQDRRAPAEEKLVLGQKREELP